MDDSSNTENNSEKKAKPRGKPFVKGDPRINRNGRPKSFDALRLLAQQVAHEVAQRGDEPIVINGHRVTITELILRSLATSKNPQYLIAFLEIAYGKVPNQVELNVNEPLHITIDK